MKIDVSIILTFHNEGILAHKTILAVLRSAQLLEKNKISYEIIAHIDNGDTDTIEYFEKFKLCDMRIFKNNFGNPADSRNFAISKANGEFLTLIDGDDLISENWLYDGYKILKKQQDIILHPEVNVTFGFNETSPRIWIMKDSFSDDEDTLILFGRNRWCSGTYLSKKIAVKYPYDGATKGYGYEDWYYNSLTRSAGIKHLVLPKSVLFYRTKDSSIYKSHMGEKTVVAYTEQFSTDNMKRIGGNFNINEDVKDKQKKDILSKTMSYGFKVCRKLPGIKKVADRAAKKIITVRSKQRINLFPGFLLEEWKKINTIDNSLYPDKDLIARMPFYDSEHDYLGRIYCRLVSELTKNPDYIFLPPELSIGGTEKVIVNYLNAIKEVHPEWHIVVLGKLPKNHQYNIADNVDFIDFDGITKNLSNYDKDFLFSRFIIQTKVKRLHIINNEFYYRWVQSHQKFIRENNFIINVSYFMHEFARDEKRIISFADPCIREIYPCINKIFTDNKSIIQEMTSNNAFSMDKISIHYQPIDLKFKNIKKNKDINEKIKILWASRVSEQKRPDILCKIAQQLDPQKYEITVYGRMQKPYTKDLFNNIQIINYKGTYKDIDEIGVENYDAFLYTSQTDGLPNILLEISAFGVPIIASNVGGIGDFIEDNKTGFLVEMNDIDGYCEALEKLINNKDKTIKIVKNAQEKIKEKHSWKKFVEKVAEDI